MRPTVPAWYHTSSDRDMRPRYLLKAIIREKEGAWVGWERGRVVAPCGTAWANVPHDTHDTSSEPGCVELSGNTFFPVALNIFSFFLLFQKRVVLYRNAPVLLVLLCKVGDIAPTERSQGLC